jgi:hypothetical protein
LVDAAKEFQHSVEVGYITRNFMIIFGKFEKALANIEK